MQVASVLALEAAQATLEQARMCAEEDQSRTRDAGVSFVIQSLHHARERTAADLCIALGVLEGRWADRMERATYDNATEQDNALTTARCEFGAAAEAAVAAERTARAVALDAVLEEFAAERTATAFASSHSTAYALTTLRSQLDTEHASVVRTLEEHYFARTEAAARAATEDREHAVAAAQANIAADSAVALTSLRAESEALLLTVVSGYMMHNQLPSRNFTSHKRMPERNPAGIVNDTIASCPRPSSRRRHRV